MATTETKLIRIGHSPDPDDAFMFYALAKEAIDMRGFRVEHLIEDIECLNQRALKAELEVTAVSCHAYSYLSDRYLVMRAGASVGDKYGPILVSSKGKFPSQVSPSDIKGKRIAIPGKLTTAYLVLQLFQDQFEAVFVPFDQVFDTVKSGKVDLGLVIHEGQITFDQHGLSNVLDLGKWWFQENKLPLPLGVDVIRRDLGGETIHSFTSLFKESILYALSHRDEALEYALEYGRGISKRLGNKFVGMYVNDFTVELGSEGQKGLQKLLDVGFDKGILPHKVQVPFVDTK